MKSIKRALTVLLLGTIIVGAGCNGRSDTSWNEFQQKGAPVNAEICEVWGDKAGMVTVISDDGNYESGLILNSLAKEYGLRVTVAGFVNNLNRNLDGWKRIEEEGNIEVISHSYSHLKIDDATNPSREEIYHEYVEARDFLAENFTTPAFCFVTPNNHTTDMGYQILKENGFLAVRQGQRGENTLSPSYGTEPGDWLNLMTRGIGDVDNTAERDVWVDTSVRDHSWLIEMWHDISPNGDLNYQPISTAMAREHLSYIAQKQTEGDIWVAPFTQAVSYLYQKQYCQVEAYCLADRLAVRISRTREDLPWEDFNVPLSIRAALPEGWATIQAADENCTVYGYESDGTVVFDTNTTQGVLYFTREK